RGDGRAGAGRGRAREVRRGLGGGDPAQRPELPGHAEVQVTVDELGHPVDQPVDHPVVDREPEPSAHRPRAVLVGSMGAGKTTVAGLLAETWGLTARDTDADIVAAD